MTSSEDVSSFETWAFRSTFDNSCFSEAFARDTEALTNALIHSFTNGTENEGVSFSKTPVHVQSVSTSGGSEIEPETKSVSKRPPRHPVSGRITKRKSRASKRSPTTFITADADNFRQMVQEVTGIGFGSGSGLVLKPEPQRGGFGSGMATRLPGNGGYLLPTLDTSAFLLGHHQQIVGPGSVGGGAQGFGPSVGETGGPGFDFDGLSCFPTLESWKVR